MITEPAIDCRLMKPPVAPHLLARDLPFLSEFVRRRLRESQVARKLVERQDSFRGIPRSARRALLSLCVATCPSLRHASYWTPPASYCQLMLRPWPPFFGRTLRFHPPPCSSPGMPGHSSKMGRWCTNPFLVPAFRALCRQGEQPAGLLVGLRAIAGKLQLAGQASERVHDGEDRKRPLPLGHSQRFLGHRTADSPIG